MGTEETMLHELLAAAREGDSHAFMLRLRELRDSLAAMPRELRESLATRYADEAADAGCESFAAGLRDYLLGVTS